MKVKLFCILASSIFICLSIARSEEKAIIINHSNCNLSQVPESYVTTSKGQIRLAYGHTSHGSQIVTGMSLLNSQTNSIYTYNKGQGSLYLNDASLLTGDLGNPDRSTWAKVTRNLLNNNTQQINTIMWSWCGQVDAAESDINTYLTLMNQLEQDFPSITFIYMTGHLNGSGVNGNVNKRNEQIRKFCRDNKKVLFDFADIESYDPDGKYFLDKNADDGCNYQGGNWADEWCAAHPELCNQTCSCAHSKCLNCQQKGKALWWLMARISGWQGIPSEVNELQEVLPDYSFCSMPNPVHNSVKFKFYVKSNNLINLTILDAIGNEVKKVINNENFSTGFFESEADLSQIPSGTYFAKYFDGLSIRYNQINVIR